MLSSLLEPLLLVRTPLFSYLLMEYLQTFLAGTYRQCDINTGDETILAVSNATSTGEYPTQLTFSQDGCRTNNTEYVVRANYTWVFSEFADSTTNYTNTEYRYSAAVAIPYPQEAVDALSSACPEATFAINTTTDVLGCLFCNVGYDIFFLLSNETFTLGASNNLTCTPAERPTDVEESIFVRVVAVTPSASPSISASP